MQKDENSFAILTQTSECFPNVSEDPQSVTATPKPSLSCCVFRCLGEDLERFSPSSQGSGSCYFTLFYPLLFYFSLTFFCLYILYIDCPQNRTLDTPTPCMLYSARQADA